MEDEARRTLVDIEWLNTFTQAQGDLLSDEVRVLDVRPLTLYLQGHIPGAVYFDLDLIVKDNPYLSVTDADLIADILGEAGITPETTIVIYDYDNGFSAARLFWTLEYYGHKRVCILDGGWRAWKQAGCALSLVAPSVERVDYETPAPMLTHRVTGDWIVQHLNDPALIMIDARPEEDFQGGSIYTQHKGRIPGAHHIDWQTNFAHGHYLTVEGLRRLYGDLPTESTIVAYSHVGYQAAVTYVALRTLGYEHVALYDDSWLEWGNRYDLPVEHD